MSEPEALHRRRQFLFEKIGQAADEIKRIDNRLSSLLEGRKGQGGAA